MKKAFTLAEVLITLGIIGVVAAMTLPVLVSNYQKTVWVNQLKKDVSTVQNGVKKIMADEEVYNIWDTTLLSTIFNNDCMYDDSEKEECIEFLKNLKKYFNGDITKPDENYKLYFMDGTLVDNLIDNYYDDTVNLSLADGSFISLSSYEEKLIIGIDVNGYKKPNKFGRDNFSFALDKDASITQLSNSNFKRMSKSDCISNAKRFKQVSDYICFNYLRSNGWKMDY